MAEDNRRGFVPPPALCGFLLLMVLVFAASYAVGRAAGPVAPGMHGSTTDSGPGPDSGTGGGADSGSGSGGMGGMHGGGH
ncbi:hypothetical protein [Streptomyces atriruber]|uniref:hypothetical protein n=1 Tax=Streptomyces atriruber TaxID=545121 RepID=UPI0006E1D438|nr:hypothetical protein [Streptomyces atriruber]